MKACVSLIHPPLFHYMGQILQCYTMESIEKKTPGNWVPQTCFVLNLVLAEVTAWYDTFMPSDLDKTSVFFLHGHIRSVNAVV